MVLAMTWQPYFAPLVIVLGCVAVGALVLLAWRRACGERPVVATFVALMRLATVVCIAVLLMGLSHVPNVVEQVTRPVLRVLVDNSASMQTADMAGESRASFAARTWLSGGAFDRLRREYEVELYAFDRTTLRVDSGVFADNEQAEAQATGAMTRVAESLRHVLASSRGKDEAGVLLISDGRDSEATPVEPVAALARSRSLPVHVVPLGGPMLRQDISVIAIPQQEYLLAGEEGRISVRVVQVGAADAQIKLHWRQGGRKETRLINFQGADAVDIELPVSETEPGLYEYELLVDPLEDEIESKNNRALVFMKVTQGRFKVLLLEGEPFWDTKFLAQSLRKDDRIELTQISQINPQRQQRVITRTEQKSARTPTTLEDLAKYDVIVIGRGIENVLDAKTMAVLPDYVSKHGGRVVFARGRSYDPTTRLGRVALQCLDEIEPVVWGRGVLRNQTIGLDPYGHGHPSFAVLNEGQTIDDVIGALPPLDVAQVVEREKASARVLARLRPRGAVGRNDGQPALVAMPYGRGMVVAVLGEGLWKWKLHSRRDKALTGVFDRFWSNMVRWLAMGSGFEPDSSSTLRLSRRTLMVGEELIIEEMRRFEQSATGSMEAVVTDPAGAQHTIHLQPSSSGSSRLTARYAPQLPGVYRVELPGAGVRSETESPHSARFFAYSIDIERVQCAADPTSLRRLAALSGGRVFDPHRPDELFELLERQRAVAVVPPRPEYLWDRAVFMFAVLGWAGLEWVIRKKGGLL